MVNNRPRARPIYCTWTKCKCSVLWQWTSLHFWTQQAYTK